MKRLASYVAKLIRTIEVRGSSMAPSFDEGDWLLFYSGPGQRRGRSLIGKVVLIAKSPELLIVKRVLRCNTENGGVNKSNKLNKSNKYWVEGDNKSASTDSRNWGEISDEEIVGVLIIRYRRGAKNKN